MSAFLMGIPAQIAGFSAEVADAVAALPWTVTTVPTPTVEYGTAVKATWTAYFTGLQVTALDLALSNSSLQTLVNVSGSGFLEYFSVHGGSEGTAYTMRAVVTIDGTDLVDYTSSSAASTARIMHVIGGYQNTNHVFNPWRIPFRTSLALKAAVSTTGVDPAANIFYRYILAQPYSA